MNRWKAAAQAAVADEKSRMVGKRGGLNLPRVIAGDSSSPAAASASLWMVSRGQIPKELEEDLRREFSEDELERINTRIHRTLAPHNKSPSALFVFGPSAVGKSFLSDAKAAELFGSAENAVEVDGAHFREEHRGWQAVRAHGYAHSMLHEEAWPLFKKYAGSTKLKVS